MEESNEMRLCRLPFGGQATGHFSGTAAIVAVLRAAMRSTVLQVGRTAYVGFLVAFSLSSKGLPKSRGFPHRLTGRLAVFEGGRLASLLWSPLKGLSCNSWVFSVFCLPIIFWLLIVFLLAKPGVFLFVRPEKHPKIAPKWHHLFNAWPTPSSPTPAVRHVSAIQLTPGGQHTSQNDSGRACCGSGGLGIFFVQFLFGEKHEGL